MNDEDVGKSALEETGEEANARRAGGFKGAHTDVVNGGLHRPGPSAGCAGCNAFDYLQLTDYERRCHLEAWRAWHRQTLLEFLE